MTEYPAKAGRGNASSRALPLGENSYSVCLQPSRINGARSMRDYYGASRTRSGRLPGKVSAEANAQSTPFRLQPRSA